jgi:hypothetical protein
MLKETLVPFRFKGGRSYVHGTDIYDSMLEMVLDYFGEYPDSVKASFHGLLENNCIFRIYESGEPLEDEQLFALFSIIMKKNMYQLVLLDAGTPISLSYEYDEQKVLKNVVLKDETITMQFKSTYTYIEQIVSMTKKLHLTIYPAAKGKWLFTKIHIHDVVDPALYSGEVIAVRSIKNFQNKLTQCSIKLNDHPIGSIFFSLMPQKKETK